MKELEKKYNPLEIETDDVYKDWVSKGYFTAGDQSKIPYTIVIPPPNVTGKLHLGHAWDNTLQDIAARYKRAQGYDVLYLPGMDHAGIATQAKIDARLADQGVSRYDLGREGFLEKAWEWKEEYAGFIREQWAKMGLGLDYSRERFTLDEGLNKAVNKVFTTLYNKGLIYQGERIINWDPQARTALSNIEVIHKDIPGKMYYFKYKVVETGDELIIATTRPETMFADQAVFVHPDDERYQSYIGKHVINPANGEKLPIMADSYIDLSFGTAVMKCTPAHDPNDFALAKKYNLEMPVCMNPDATMNELAGEYKGMDRFECREKLVEDFEKRGVVDHIEEHLHSVGHSERTDVIVEPYLSKQWFVRMKPLAQAVLDAEKEGEIIRFIPERFHHTFEQWLENIEDWCISRQLWWGHRIPAWFHKETGEVYVGETAPENIDEWVQDEDVLDTWFSSALWPFSTLGWPEETEDFNRYYPTNLMVTGYDIIFFWVARMAFQGKEMTGTKPFEDVLIHGLIRDKQGRKMSKSLGNGVDPIAVINEKGADALRFFLSTNSAPGLDMRYDETKVDASWNFINKLWNAARYVQMQLEAHPAKEIDYSKLSEADLWILARLNETIENVTRNMDRYELAIAGNEIYSFVWNDYCSWYLELTKAALKSDDPEVVANTAAILKEVLRQILVLLSPFVPFVTDHIYKAMDYDKESINLETWPAPVDLPSSEKAVSDMQVIIDAIEAVREIKTEYGIKPREILQISLTDENGNPYPLSDQGKTLLCGMAKTELVDLKPGEDILTRPIPKASVLASLNDLVDTEAELEKLRKEKERLEKEIARASKMLANPGFVAKAPKEKIEQEKAKLASYQDQLLQVQKQLEK